MRVKFWGVRGSTPTPQAGNLRYGGNTSCVEVRHENSLYIFDCGTGFRTLGQQLESEANGQPIRAHIFVSHFHWDHIQGIPFFRPLYENSENQFAFHSSRRTRTLERVMEEQMASPYFPVNTSEMKATRNFYAIEEGQTQVDTATVRALWLNHPQGCMGFRLETKDGILVYATDNEPGDEWSPRHAITIPGFAPPRKAWKSRFSAESQTRVLITLQLTISLATLPHAPYTARFVRAVGKQHPYS
jgi:phosphoribosyl 1,2-cyclic phosphodiesterase